MIVWADRAGGRSLEAEICRAGELAGRQRLPRELIVFVPPECVFLSCFDHDVAFYASMLGGGGIRLHRAETLETADFLLVVSGATVLISDPEFLDGTWSDALDMMATFHPLTSCVVCPRGQDQAGVQAMRQRAFAVCERPFEVDSWRYSIERAHEATLERRLWSATKKLEALLQTPAQR